MTASQGGRPGTCKSTAGIVNVLMAYRRQAAAASHIVAREPATSADKQVISKATQQAVTNICRKNSKLPLDLVQRLAQAEFTDAQLKGRLFTSKEVGDIEDRIYTLVMFKLSHTD